MRVGGNFSTQPQVSLDASRGVATSNRYNGTPPNELVTYKLGWFIYCTKILPTTYFRNNEGGVGGW